MLSQVVNINVDLGTRYEHLKFVVVKCPQPVDVNDVVKTTTERLHVWTDLYNRKYFTLVSTVLRPI